MNSVNVFTLNLS